MVKMRKKSRKKSVQASASETAAGTDPLPSTVPEDGAGAATITKDADQRPRKRRKRVEGLQSATEATVGDKDELPEVLETEGIPGDPDDRKGIVYVASVPGFMQPGKLRHLMEQYGEVGRMYCKPEEKANWMDRKKAGGSYKHKFVEAWVEYTDRRTAKNVAMMLNATPIGGKRRNFYYHDLWNLKYLPKMKWHQLHENEIYDRRVRKARLEQRMTQARRENNFYLENVHKAKTHQKIKERKAKKAEVSDDGKVRKTDQQMHESTAKMGELGDKGSFGGSRQLQRPAHWSKSVADEPPPISDRILAKLF